jgi:hypothetical protein
VSPLVRSLLLDTPLWSPYRLPNKAAIYSLDGGEGDATYLTNGLGRVRLIADRSGNSAENCLVLSGAGSNYASTTKLVPTGTWRIEAKVAATDWTSASSPAVAAVYNGTGDNRSWFFGINASGAPYLLLSSDGTSGTTQTVTASQAVPFVDLACGYVAATVNLAAGTVNFETSTDGVAWSALGTQRTFTSISLYAGSTAVLEVGSNAGGSATNFAGLVYWVRIYQTGVLTRNFDPSGAVKLAASFVAPTTGETWTINTSGDLGARISGARDLYQGTTLKMALLSTGSDGRNVATFDGSNDYMKAAPFSLSQPETVYFVGSQVTWTSGEFIYDGNANDTMVLQQNTSTPRIIVFAGGSVVGTTELAIAARGVVCGVYNGASSSIRANRGQSTTGNAGSNNAGGVTLGGAGTAGASPSNITFCEAAIFSAAQSESTQLRVATFMGRKWAFAV